MKKPLDHRDVYGAPVSDVTCVGRNEDGSLVRSPYPSDALGTVLKSSELTVAHGAAARLVLVKPAARIVETMDPSDVEPDDEEGPEEDEPEEDEPDEDDRPYEDGPLHAHGDMDAPPDACPHPAYEEPPVGAWDDSLLVSPPPRGRLLRRLAVPLFCVSGTVIGFSGWLLQEHAMVALPQPVVTAVAPPPVEPAVAAQPAAHARVEVASPPAPAAPVAAAAEPQPTPAMAKRQPKNGRQRSRRARSAEPTAAAPAPAADPLEQALLAKLGH